MSRLPYPQETRPKYARGFLAFQFFLALSLALVWGEAAAGQAPKKNPCQATEELKAYLKKTPGMIDPSLVKCVPLEVTLLWEVEETHQWFMGFQDRVKLRLEEKFPARLELNYNPEKKSELASFSIIGPSPCCPGEVAVTLEDIQAHVLAISRDRRKSKPYSTDNPLLFTVTPSAEESLGFDWDRTSGGKGGFGSSRIRYGNIKVDQGYSASNHVLSPSHYRVKVTGEESLSWKEVQEGLDKEELVIVFPLQETIPIPLSNETHSLNGQVTLHIAFGEQEEERWRVSVDAVELDDLRPKIEYKDPQTKELKKLDVRVWFEWRLEGEFVLRKFKKSLGYKEGRVTKAGILPKIEIPANDLYWCSTASCANVKLVQAGDLLMGITMGRSVKLTWPRCPSAACVTCTPRKSFLGKVPYRQQFGLNDFMRILSDEVLTLQNGFTKSGAQADWLKYKITLIKMN